MYSSHRWYVQLLRPGPGNHSKLTPGGRPMFLKPKLHKEYKMGSKQSIVDPTQYYFFQKSIFGAKKSSK